MEMLQGVWKQHLRPRAVVGYGVKIFLPSPPNYVTRSPGLCLSPQILHKLCFQFLLGLTNGPKRIHKQCLCKILGDNEGYYGFFFPKWPIELYSQANVEKHAHWSRE